MRRTLARVALFIIYFWFGALKVIGASPVTPLVTSLLTKTMPFMPPAQFLIAFGLFEMLIGLLFLFPKYKRVTIVLFAIHMVMTSLPLILLPHMVWQGFLIPTLEGQFIIKNVALIALVATL